MTTAEAEELKELRRENRELKRANDRSNDVVHRRSP
jgi:transposase-like protein